MSSRELFFLVADGTSRADSICAISARIFSSSSDRSSSAARFLVACCSRPTLHSQRDDSGSENIDTMTMSDMTREITRGSRHCSVESFGSRLKPKSIQSQSA
jgi:hypothetical protein